MGAGTRHATARDRGGTDSERVRDDSFEYVSWMLGDLNTPADLAVYIVTRRKSQFHSW